MTSLNLAHELISLKDPMSSFDARDAKRRIAAMEARLDAALAPQENLF
jgi:cell division protein ZapA (FtsZ GTPase activity inhibitor)